MNEEGNSKQRSAGEWPLDGGELGDLIRKFDWSKTSIGPKESWSSSIKTATDLILRTPVPIVMLCGPDGIMIYNDAYSKFAGRRHPKLLGSPVLQGWPEVADFNRHVMDVCLAGGTLSFKDHHLTLHRYEAPEDVWMNLDYSPVLEGDGKPVGVLAIVRETTERFIAERQRSAAEAALREHARVVSLINDTAAALSLDRGLEQLVQSITDAGVALTKAEFGAFFYNVDDEHGGKYTLYTLSGAPREAFAKFPMPRNTAVFGPTFKGESIVRSDDITKDPRYGHNRPYHGMPKGHLPVRSYLAIPVRSRKGEVLGGLFFGHSQPGMFTAQSEAGLVGLAAQAAIAIDNAQLVQDLQREVETRTRAEAELKQLAETLEERVRVRTHEALEATKRLATEAAGRERAEDAARLSEEQFHMLVEGVRDYAIYTLDPEGYITSWNAGAERFKGYSASEIMGRHFSTFYTEEDKASGLPQTALETARREGIFEHEGWRVRKDGTRFWASVVINAIYAEGSVVGFAKITRDITEKREAQKRLDEARQQLFQAQKMDAIGQLTGGVAHDFNNLLQVVSGNLQLLAKDVSGNAPAERKIRNALAGVSRGSALASQLLSFGRRQLLDPKAINIGRLVRGMDELIRRALGEEIELETIIGGGLWNTFVDPTQVENAILNLVINARDAMEGGGKLTIEVGNSFLSDDYAMAHEEVKSGQYVLLAVTDTGSGIPPDVVSKVFEPFFTTKPEGKGTGLGLSMVYGFVKQSGGHVKIYSEVGHGTTVKIYLPRTMQAEDTINDINTGPIVGGTETILVVEDDEAVRNTVVEMLGQAGYRVVYAKDAQSALAIIDSGLHIDLLFSDVVMPGPLRSNELGRKAKERLPGIAVLFTSGYTENSIVHGGRLDPGTNLIAKPYTAQALSRKIRQVLASEQQRQAVSSSVVSTSIAPAPGNATSTSVSLSIVLVEDEVLIRELAQLMMEDLGHKVRAVTRASDALEEIKLHDTDVLVTDISLPGASGVELALQARQIKPNLAVVFATGYQPKDKETHDLPLRTNVAWLSKPYDSKALQQAIEQALK